ncbi:MAG: hypothetical protein Unbinned6805contig1000_37 [Prokaryotic dsDNA virus sp.]|nr:MAG: hypothetical protein Unbinned6805contig1000_37 [Prokaryotic dsDNA virus sp.]|tara:strand:+ start:36736 stop:37215 length:480 start_codon:yes stop_codon:yes gene_type:complete
MANKIELDSIGSGFNKSKINANFQKIQDELNNRVAYRDYDPDEPNQWEKSQDANNKRLINMPEAVSAGEPITLSQALGLILTVVPPGTILTLSTLGSSGTGGNVFDLNSIFGVTVNSLPDIFINGIQQTSPENYSLLGNIVTLTGTVEDTDKLTFKVGI